MSATEPIGRLRQGLAVPRAGGNLALTIAAITLVAALYQLRWGTVPDTSWLITVCERVLAGDLLYKDVFESNPPFSIWMYLGPVAAAHILDISPEFAVQAWTYLLVIAGFVLAILVAHRANFPENEKLFCLAPAAYFVLVVFPGSAFSEREHIAMALFLPLLMMTAWRARPDASSSPGFGLSVLTGLLASVLLLVKPFYAVMVLAPCLYAAWRRKSLAPIFAVENWVIGLVCSAYLASVFYLHPEFMRDIYPLLADTYLKMRSYLSVLVIYGTSWAGLMLLVWRFWPKDGSPELASVMTIASAAGMIPLIYQAKGWAYHAYPALACAIFALLCLAALPRDGRKPRWTGAFPLMMNPTRTLIALLVIVAYAPFWVSQKPGAQLVQDIRAATIEPRVAVVASDLAAGHPLTRMVGGRWVSFYNSDWLGVFSMLLTANAHAAGDATAEQRYRAMLDQYAAFKIAEFERNRPEIVVVDIREKYWLPLVIRRFGFDRVLAGYHLIGGWKNMRVFLRNDLRVPVSSSPASASN